jgi:hypothetical protein
VKASPIAIWSLENFISQSSADDSVPSTRKPPHRTASR